MSAAEDSMLSVTDFWTDWAIASDGIIESAGIVQQKCGGYLESRAG